YLSQPDADAQVCDLRARGPHVTLLDDEMRSSLLEALAEGSVEARLWQRCAATLLRSAPPSSATALVEAAGRLYKKLIKDHDCEGAPSQQAKLVPLQQLYLERRNGLDARAEVAEPLFAQLREALARRLFGPIATKLAADLLTTSELEHNRYGGRPVDVSTL